MERNYGSYPQSNVPAACVKFIHSESAARLKNSLGFCDTRHDSAASRPLQRQYGYPMVR